MKSGILASIFAGVTFSLAAQATVVSGKIQSVNLQKSRVLVVGKQVQDLDRGAMVNIGNNCTLEVVKKSKNRAILSSDLCDQIAVLKKGSIVKLTTDELNSNNDSEIAMTPTSRSGIYRPRTSSPTRVSKGIRIGLYKSFLDAKADISTNFGSGSYKEDAKQEIGLGVGYASININSLGFAGNLIYNRFDGEAESFRLDANATTGINKNLYLFGGINAHDFTNAGDAWDVGFGFQLGMGAQFNEAVGMSLSYLVLNNKADFSFGTAELEVSGIELSIHATF